MATLLVTADTLQGLARNPQNIWMRSLEPVRQIIYAAGPSCGSCPSAPASLGHQLTKKTYLAVAGSAAFRNEIKLVQQQLGYTDVQITMDGVIDTLP